jgi:hypothetical protein
MRHVRNIKKTKGKYEYLLVTNLIIEEISNSTEICLIFLIEIKKRLFLILFFIQFERA